MIVLDNLVRIEADRLNCRIIREGVPSEFTIRFTQPDENLRGLSIEGMSFKEEWELTNRDEFKALMKTLWAFVDGEPVMLPKEIESEPLGSDLVSGAFAGEKTK